MSLADRFKAEVTLFREQNSVAKRKAANVSEWMYISCSFDSKNARHCGLNIFRKKSFI